MVHLYSSTETCKKSHFILTDTSDFLIIDVLVIAAHAFCYAYVDITFSQLISEI